MFLTGWKLIITPKAITHHFRQNDGGIRDFRNKEYWEHDEKIFEGYMERWERSEKQPVHIVLDCGMGDHIAFKMVLPEIKEKYQDRKSSDSA